jgi:hypothetical protein
VEYEGPDLTGLCLDFDDPSRVFVGGVSERLDLRTTLGILEAAVEEVQELALEPLETGDLPCPAAAVRKFLWSRGGCLPRYLQLIFDPGQTGERPHLSKTEIRRFINACGSILKGLAKAPAGEPVVATAGGHSWVQATCLTAPEPSWQLRAVPEPKPDKRNLDVPLLSEARMPPLPASGRPSTIVRRVDFPALEKRTGELDKELAALQRPVTVRYQAFLDQLVGEACPSAEDNNKLVKLVNGQADQFGLALLCKGNGRAYKHVRLRYSSGVFEAWTPGRDGEQVYSGAGFPPLRVRPRAGLGSGSPPSAQT